MVKTTLYLPDDLKRALERLARSRGISEAELFREALRVAVHSAEKPRPAFPYGTGDGSRGASRVDELLAGTGFGEC